MGEVNITGHAVAGTPQQPPFTGPPHKSSRRLLRQAAGHAAGEGMGAADPAHPGCAPPPASHRSAKIRSLRSIAGMPRAHPADNVLENTAVPSIADQIIGADKPVATRKFTVPMDLRCASCHAVVFKGTNTACKVDATPGELHEARPRYHMCCPNCRGCIVLLKSITSTNAFTVQRGATVSEVKVGHSPSRRENHDRLSFPSAHDLQYAHKHRLPRPAQATAEDAATSKASVSRDGPILVDRAQHGSRAFRERRPDIASIGRDPAAMTARCREARNPTEAKNHAALARLVRQGLSGMGGRVRTHATAAQHASPQLPEGSATAAQAQAVAAPCLFAPQVPPAVGTELNFPSQFQASQAPPLPACQTAALEAAGLLSEDEEPLDSRGYKFRRHHVSRHRALGAPADPSSEAAAPGASDGSARLDAEHLRNSASGAGMPHATGAGSCLAVGESRALNTCGNCQVSGVETVMSQAGPGMINGMKRKCNKCGGRDGEVVPSRVPTHARALPNMSPSRASQTRWHMHAKNRLLDSDDDEDEGPVLPGPPQQPAPSRTAPHVQSRSAFDAGRAFGIPGLVAMHARSSQDCVQSGWAGAVPAGAAAGRLASGWVADDGAEAAGNGATGNGVAAGGAEVAGNGVVGNGFASWGVEAAGTTVAASGAESEAIGVASNGVGAGFKVIGLLIPQCQCCGYVSALQCTG